MKIIQIDVACNVTSTGKIAEGIGLKILEHGGESHIAYGRYSTQSRSQMYKIGTTLDTIFHGLVTRLFDLHGLASIYRTKKLCKLISEIEPDVIHLHCIHGYYLNYEILFDFVNLHNYPVVWTQHDCWSFTGHCAYFELAQCFKWKNSCSSCPLIKEYPKSLFVDNSNFNYELKRKLFTSVRNMTLVPVSHWLENYLRDSFLSRHDIKMIHNGINTNLFTPIEIEKEKIDFRLLNKFIVLGVASPWTQRKGFDDFLKLSKCIDSSVIIVLIGLSKLQLKQLPSNIIGLTKTDSVHELAQYYSLADVFFNPTWEDNYPTTNLESISCGTPVITYKTGGSVESICDQIGFILEQGDYKGVLPIIDKIKQIPKENRINQCREYALLNFKQEDKFSEYYELYKQITK